MKIRRFVGNNIHGYLNFDIKFFPDINFLTGINGSGKTSVVNGISALISPSLIDLAMTDYERMEVELEGDDSEVISLFAEKTAERVRIGSNKHKAFLDVPLLSDEMYEYTQPARAREEQQTFYREHEAKSFNNPILRLIKALPTPMFLDIERRLERLYDKRSATARRIIRRRNPNIFKLNLHRSLWDASALAEDTYREAKGKQENLTEDFRKEVILTSIEFHDTPSNLPPTFPILDKAFFANKIRIKETLVMLGLSEEKIDGSLNPFFSRLEDLTHILPPGGNVQEFLIQTTKEKFTSKSKKNEEKQTQEITAIMDWMVNRPQYYRIIRIKELVEGYLQKAQNLFETFNKYLSTVNTFLNDSGKRIGFNKSYDLVVTFDDGTERPITSLASGESQIVVMLTHLFFNPDAQAANVFIVDEPELSLHIRWQELFVESIRAANPSLQLILATHSPAIILEDDEHCIDISGGQTIK